MKSPTSVVTGSHPDCPEGKVITVSVSIKPLEDRIVVKSLEAEQTTASGLVIPDTAKEKPQEGEVLAVGPGRWNEDGDWKRDYNNLERMPPEEVARRRAEFDKVKQTALDQRKKAGVA